MNSKLDKDSISQPELWKLALTVSTDRMDVALFPPVTRQEMIWRSYMFDPATPSALKAIEDIIYDNPLLLSDFKRVDCIIDNVAAIPLPAAMTPEQMAGCYLRATDSGLSNIDSHEIEIYPTADPECRIALRQDPEIKAFFARTFYNVSFDCRLSALCRYLNSRADAPQGPEMNLLPRDGRLTIVVIDNHRILMANEFRYDSDIDAVYYVMASIGSLNLDQSSVAISIYPMQADEPDTLTGLLRRFLPQIAPIPFPMLRYRASRSTLQAPFELLIRPLCE